MRRIELDDIALYYRLEGSGPPVLLLHGLGSSAADWELVLPVLAARRKVLAPDLRGHGASSKPHGRSSVGLLASDVAALVRRLGLPALHVVGVSLGGMIALELALDHTEVVRSLALVNSGPSMRLGGGRERAAILGRIATLRLFGMSRLAGDLAARLFPKPEQAALRDTFVTRWCANDPVAYERTLRGMLGWSVRARLGRVACPTLVVSGDRDYTSVAEKAAWARALPDARLVVVEDSGHFTPFDQPERLNDALLRFFDEVESRGGARRAAEEVCT